jgi:hypothetical protein
MAAVTPPGITPVALERVVNRRRTVPLDHELLCAARAIGVTFGD